MTSISVVVPVYNVEPYLEECLRSLERQSLRDFEAICVDDGSTDGSLAILSEWESRVSWLRVVHKENGGVSSARNAALDRADGQYVCFLDGDDVLVDDALERIVKSMSETQAEVLTYGGFVFPEKTEDAWLESALVSQEASWRGFDAPQVFRTAERSLVLLAVSQRLLNDGLRFDESLTVGEDLLFRFSAMARARAVATVSDSLYGYRIQRDGSAMSAATRDERLRLSRHLQVVRALLHDLDSLGLLDCSASELVHFIERYVIIDALALDDEVSSSLLGQLREILSQIRPTDYWASCTDDRSEGKALRRTLGAAGPSHLERRIFRSYYICLHYGRLAMLRSLFS